MLKIDHYELTAWIFIAVLAYLIFLIFLLIISFWFNRKYVNEKIADLRSSKDPFLKWTEKANITCEFCGAKGIKRAGKTWIPNHKKTCPKYRKKEKDKEEK